MYRLPVLFSHDQARRTRCPEGTFDGTGIVYVSVSIGQPPTIEWITIQEFPPSYESDN